MKKTIAGALTAAFALGGLIVTGAVPAAAAELPPLAAAPTSAEPSQTFSGSCGSATFDFAGYPGTAHVVVKLGGKVVADQDFTGSLSVALTPDPGRWTDWSAEIYGSTTVDHFSSWGDFPPCTDEAYGFRQDPYFPSCDAYIPDIAFRESKGVVYERTGNGATARPHEGYVLAGGGSWYDNALSGMLHHDMNSVDAPDCTLKVNYVKTECIDGKPYVDFDVDTLLGMSPLGTVSVAFFPSELTAETFGSSWHGVWNVGHQDAGDHIIWPTWIPLDDPTSGDVAYAPPTAESAARWAGKKLDLYLEMWSDQPVRTASVYIDAALSDPCAPTGPTAGPTSNPADPTAGPTTAAPAAGATGTPVANPVASGQPSAGSTVPVSGPLARTGATVGAAVGFAALLLVGGATLIWFRRRLATSRS